MSTLVLRSVVNRALTSPEIDANFDNLNTDKVETTAPVFSGTVTLPSQSIALTDSNLPDVAPSLNLDFANSKQLDSRITFGRGSGGAYYDGKTTAKAEENLLKYSQDFSQSIWTKYGISIDPTKYIAPDGSLTANKIIEDTSVTSSHQIVQLISPNKPGYSSSIYLKYGGRQWVCFSLDGGGVIHAYFDILNGIVGSVNSYYTSASITAVGSDWYRCTVAHGGLGYYSRVMGADSNGSFTYTGDGTSGIYIWGAQLEQRSSVTAYTPTTTAPITNYIPVLLQAPLNTPRFDHDSRPTFNGTCTVSGSSVTLPATFADGSSPSTINKFYTGSITISGTAYVITNYVGSTRVVTVTGGTPTAGAFSLVNKNYGQSLGLLIEEGRTNNFTLSTSALSNWGKVYTTIISNICVAPDGTLTGSLAIPDVISYQHFISTNVALSGITTFSIYAKNGGYNWLALAGSGGGFTTFNLATGQLGTIPSGVTASMVSVGNGWYRCSVTQTYAGSASYVFVEPGDGQATWTPNGYSGIYIWGAQLEAGSFATSYIPTPSNATVTRQPDLVSMTGTNFSSWYNQSEGTLYDEVDFYSGSNEHSFALIGPSYTNFGITNLKPDSTHRAYDVYANPNVYVGRQTFNYSPSQKYKEVVAYTNTYYMSSMNGVISSPTYGNITTNNATRLLLGQYFFSLTMCGHIRKLTYYPKALSASKLQGLTK